jgi:F-type H+-transporting ATPase subunit a
MNFFTDILQVQREIPGIEPQILFDVFGIPVATSSFMIFFIIILFLVLGIIIRTTFRVYPTKFQVLFEELYAAMRDLIDEVTNDVRRSDAIFPMIGTIFLYLLVANVITLIPGIGDITVNGNAIFATPTADFNTTLGLALGAVIIINLISIREWGIMSYIGNFIKVKPVVQGFRKSMGDGAMALVDMFVGVLDIVGEIAKVISLSIRLFANMYAGSILMIILMGAFAYVVPAIWYGMSLFVGALQAMVFATLVAAYYMLAVKPSEELLEEAYEETKSTAEISAASVAEAA